MDTFLMVVVLACLVMITILYFELRAMQARMEDMRGDVDARIRSGLSDMAEPVGKIPALEHRIQGIERDVAVLQPVTVVDTAAPHPDRSPSTA